MLFFLRTFTFVCTIGINERVYVFWALSTYMYEKKNAALENSPYTHAQQNNWNTLTI